MIRASRELRASSWTSSRLTRGGIGDHSSLMFPAVSSPATREADVAGHSGRIALRPEPQEISQLRPLRIEHDKAGKSGKRDRSGSVVIV
jgi:hypothetical protein